jgi:antitoxin (DNA-binding transcriptional repressor) of toxin-antitoxin stability system
MGYYLVHFLVVIQLNIHEAKTHLSRYLARLAKGETIILCKRGVPIAEIRPLTGARKAPRPAGLAKGQFEIPPGFFEPLPDDVLAGFDGGG